MASPIDYIIVDEKGKYVRGTDRQTYPEDFLSDLVDHFSSNDQDTKTQYLETHLINNGVSENVLILARKFDRVNWCISILKHDDLRLNTKSLEERHFNLKSMLSVFAHEFRNPLASLIFAVDLMRESCDDTELFDIIYQNSRSMARMLDDLHDYQGFRDGKFTLNKRQTYINKIIRDSIRHVDEDFLRVSIGNTDNVTVNVDEVRFSQLIRNIVGNSIKFRSSAPLKVEILTQISDGAVVIRINDNGKGIASEEITKINLPFFQANQDLSRNYGGLGLGLYISQTIVNLHNGKLEVFSEGENKGTQVIITLPIYSNKDGDTVDESDTEIKDIAIQDSNPKDQQSQFNVLLVEDDPDLGRLLIATFAKYKLFNATLASDAYEAIAQFGQKNFDLVVSDIGLPEMDGFTLKKKLDVISKNETKFIAMTGYSDGEISQRIQDSGFMKHLVKPVIGAKMISEVKEVLGISQ